MEFNQLVLGRYSCRNYKAEQVPREIINELFNICRFAPSAVNNQPWEFIVVTQPDLLSKVKKSYKQTWIQSVSTLIIALADTSKAWVRHDNKNHADIDLAIFIDHFTLAATEKGLATCWVCNFDAAQIKTYFNLPDNIEPIAIIPLGYPANAATTEKKRKTIGEFVYFNTYQK